MCARHRQAGIDPRRLAVCAAVLLAWLAACAVPSAPPTELTVYAAASLADAFTELASVFEAANPGARIVHSYAGSNQLAAQINQGAPADVFASANTAQMGVVAAAGNVVPGAERIFARNRLVVVVPKDNRASVRTLQDLGRPGLKIVLADRAVPAGAYALDFLTRAEALPEFTADYSQAVLSNVASYEENVRSVLGKVVLGEADAGVVYTSDVGGTARDKVARIEIPDPLNTPAAYPIAIVKATKHAALAERYVAFVLSPDGQAILARHGFLPAAP